MSDAIPTLETLRLSLADKVATVTLNRPDKANAMNWQMWQDIRSAMQWADRTPGVRAVVLQGEGKHFTSGIDLTMMMGLQGQIQDDCDGRMREKLRALILELQDTLTSLERGMIEGNIKIEPLRHWRGNVPQVLRQVLDA